MAALARDVPFLIRPPLLPPMDERIPTSRFRRINWFLPVRSRFQLMLLMRIPTSRLERVVLDVQDVLIYVDVIPNKQSIFSSQIRTPSFPINWPSLVSKGLRSDKPSHKDDSNKYQTKAFVICDHKSDQTRSATHVNKTYLVWLMYWLLFNQHYQHRTNQKLRSWANAVFQNRGVCGQAFPSLPSASPVIPFFSLSSKLSRRTREETLAMQASILVTMSPLLS